MKTLPLFAVFRSISVSLTALLLLASALDARTWTDTRGRSIEAEFVSFDGSEVTLRLANGRTTSVALTKLSQADRDYVSKLSEDKDQSEGKADEGETQQAVEKVGDKAFPYPEQGVTFYLGDKWNSLDTAIAKRIERELLSKLKNEFLTAEVSGGMVKGNKRFSLLKGESVLVGSRESFHTPEELLKAFPKMRMVANREVKESFNKEFGEMTVEEAEWNSTLKAIVVTGTTMGVSNKPLLGKIYLLPMRERVLIIVASTPPDTADAFLGEVEQSIATIEFAPDQEIEESFIQELEAGLEE